MTRVNLELTTSPPVGVSHVHVTQMAVWAPTALVRDSALARYVGYETLGVGDTPVHTTCNTGIARRTSRKEEASVQHARLWSELACTYVDCLQFKVLHV